MRLLVWASSLFVAVQSLPWQDAPPHAQDGDAGRPRLIVLVVVDQLRGDYLDRFAAHFGPDGFNRLTREGAYFVNAHFSHGSTATGPGHASIATGANPCTHGISANDDEHAEASADPKFPIVGLDDEKRAAKGGSPVRLLAPTLGDVMKMSSNGRTRVAAVGLKRRAAVTLGGRNGDCAVWWDDKSGRLVTSRYYAKSLPAWVAEMNRAKFTDQFFGKVWNRALPADAYASCVADDDPNERGEFGLGRAFPHVVNGGLARPDAAYYAAVELTPFGNEVVLECARQAVKHEGLGTDSVFDLLCIALASNDVCGHSFGPDSHEVLDITVRTDRQLAELWRFLDETVGRGQYVVALTGDHGVAPIAAHVQRFKLDAGTFDEAQVVEALNATVRRTFNVASPGVKPVAAIAMPWLHLNQSAIRDAGLSFDAVLETCMRELRRTPGVGVVWPASQLADASAGNRDPLFELARRAYHPQMAGEAYIGLSPYWHKAGDAASHGTGHSYDRHVPILLGGPGVRAGRYFAPADPIDIVRTLALLIGVEPAPTMTGRVLHEAVGTSQGR